ncbi:hypothetical protein [Alteraurantiacibacter buctensis]|uniref:Ketopantoate reductase N-terminal domain-containing protein n=1 Tax=Alteraurantiacibacter buctensis TaxID=1503981 RepID=A0A844YXZ8_9SPHN|nr:hypothetical protein [Alteraurantiacibacter buctensis]MXO71878.1 hypothetical protein [Alteraurantiacibacter buctensis]
MNVLVLGASYGLLPAIKLALAGHAVTVVGREDEIAAMADGPVQLEMAMRRTGQRIVLAAPLVAHPTPGSLTLRTPAGAAPEQADFALLAMQEPHFAAPAVAALMARIAAARVPCLSLMNLPPPTFLARLDSVPESALEGVYSAPQAWAGLDPALISVASPDAQALRLDGTRPGVLTVTLASNFKAAPFADHAAQSLLERLARDMSHLHVLSAGEPVRPPVALIAATSRHVPLVKWPMLLAGNCRSVTRAEPRPIAEAIHADLPASRALYDAVSDLVLRLGARPADLVPFDTYARAAAQLTRPSSIARALDSGAKEVERIDRLVLNLLRHHGRDVAPVAEISSLIDALLEANRSPGHHG